MVLDIREKLWEKKEIMWVKGKKGGEIIMGPWMNPEILVLQKARFIAFGLSQIKQLCKVIFNLSYLKTISCYERIVK